MNNKMPFNNAPKNNTTKNTEIGGDNMNITKDDIYHGMVREAIKNSKNIEALFGYKPKIMNSYKELNALGLLLSTCKQNAFFSGKERSYGTNIGTYNNLIPGRCSFITLDVGEKIMIGGIEVTATKSKFFKQYTMQAGKWVIVYWGKIVNSEGADDGYIFQVFKESWKFNEYMEEKKKSYNTEDVENNNGKVEEIKSKIEIKNPDKKSTKRKTIETEMIELKEEDIQKRILENSANNLTEA